MRRIRDVDELEKQSFVEEHSFLIEEVETEIGQLIWLHNVIVMSECTAIKLGATYEAFQLFQRSIDSLIASLNLIKQRYQLQSMTVLRTVVETGCTAVHIARDKEAYGQYEQGGYKSKRSLAIAKQVVAGIGNLFGILSKYAVHPNRAAFGSSRIVLDNGDIENRITISHVKKIREIEYDKNCLSLVGLTSVILNCLLRDVYFEESHLGSFFVKLRGGVFHISNDPQNKISKWERKIISL